MNQDVKQGVYEAVVEVAGADFAFSYLLAAKQIANRIRPHTLVAWERIRKNEGVMLLLHKAGIALVKPEPFSPERDRPAGESAVAALLGRAV